MGLGYTIWFGIRYLLFKVRVYLFIKFLVKIVTSGIYYQPLSKHRLYNVEASEQCLHHVQENRDELLIKVEDLKRRIVGSGEEL